MHFVIITGLMSSWNCYRAGWSYEKLLQPFLEAAAKGQDTLLGLLKQGLPKRAAAQGHRQLLPPVQALDAKVASLLLV